VSIVFHVWDTADIQSYKFRSDHYPLGLLKNPTNRILVGKPHGKRLLIR